MPMPRKVCCVRCGGHTDVVGPLSARKRCWDCGVGVMIRNAVSLQAKRGPGFELWREAMVEAVANLYRSPNPSALDAFDVETVETLRDVIPAALP